MHLPHSKRALQVLFATTVPSLAFAQATNPTPVPNATATVPIQGRRLDVPYPGQWIPASNTSWTMQLNITDNYHTSTDQDVTIFSVAIRPPNPPSEAALFDESGNWNVDRNISDTWEVTALSLGFRNDNLKTGLENQDDGSCEGILSDACTDAMTKAFLGSGTASQGNVSLNVAQLQQNTSACPWGSGGAIARSFVLNQNFSRSATFNWQILRTSETGGYDNAYNHFGVRSIPFAFLWGHSGTIDKGETPGSDHVTFACIKADEAVGDSSMPSSGMNNVAANSLSVLVMAGIVVALHF